jgi:hypothetical protein
MIPWMDFYTIEETMDYHLSDKVSQILTQLSVVVGVPQGEINQHNNNENNNKEPNDYSVRNHRNHINRRDTGSTGNNGMGTNANKGPRGYDRSNHKEKETDWENLRKPSDFKTTKIEKKIGIEKIINDIRVILNKLTDKNYNKLKEEIFEKIFSINNNTSGEVVMEEKDEKEEGYKLVAHTLFEIASTNKFFSKIYAQLYAELMSKFSIYYDIVIDFSKKFMDQVNKIKYVNPDIDYDGYCAYVKEQDSRRATTGFMVYLVYFIKNKESSNLLWNEIENIMSVITHKIEIQVLETDKTNEIEEMVEILFLLVTGGGKEKVLEYEINKELIERWKIISQKKVKEFPSWSSRSLFKMSDLVKLC